jgi:hypothetical protein
MASEWYVSINGETKGPLSTSELKRWLKERKIAKDSFVRQGNDGPWRAVGKVRLPASGSDIVNILALSAVLVIAFELILLLWADPLGGKLALAPLGAYLAAILYFWPKRAGKRP